MRWTKAVAVAACLAAGAAFAQGSTSGGTTATPDKSTDTTKSDPAKMESKSTTKDPKAAPKGTTDKDKDTSATGTGGSASDPAKK